MTRLVLAGDVMTGRGVDQVLPRPLPPQIQERYVRDARDYVHLAASVNGPVPAPVPPSWPWGAVLETVEAWRPDAQVMNLETAVTRAGAAQPGKAVHYRMSPENVGCLEVAGTDVWTLANNHVLDYGPAGLEETLATLRGAGQRSAGAGMDEQAAWRPAAVDLHGGRRLLVWSVADASSGTPASWRAFPKAPGVAVLPELSLSCADALVAHVHRERRPGDLVLVSVHWGANWGYRVPADQVRFAHRLVDGGVDVVHGHSSHHARPMEVHRGRLVLYGCGDLVNDYEGISGYDEYRDDLRLLYRVDVHPETGELRDLRMRVFHARRIRLEPAVPEDVSWLAGVLGRESRRFGCAVTAEGDCLQVSPLA
ncbi:MAG TPA: CapA family protein [Nocardioidaceae bacterium]